MKNLDRRFNDLATLRRDLDEITSIILVKKRIFDIIGSMQSDLINCERMIASLSNTKAMREKQLKVQMLAEDQTSSKLKCVALELERERSKNKEHVQTLALYDKEISLLQKENNDLLALSRRIEEELMRSRLSSKKTKDTDSRLKQLQDENFSLRQQMR